MKHEVHDEFSPDCICGRLLEGPDGQALELR
jgi:hypothetical protein